MMRCIALGCIPAMAAPAELVSASPAENFTGERIQLRGFFINRKSKNAGHESPLNTLFFDPKNGEPLNV
jgi:hypothetical protein